MQYLLGYPNVLGLISFEESLVGPTQIDLTIRGNKERSHKCWTFSNTNALCVKTKSKSTGTVSLKQDRAAKWVLLVSCFQVF